MRSFIFRIMIKCWAIIAPISGDKCSCRGSKSDDWLFLHGYEIRESASEIVRGGKARVNAHHARPDFLGHFASATVQSLPIGCICAAAERLPVHSSLPSTPTRISRKGLFEFAPTARVTPARPSINNTPYTPCHRALCVPTRAIGKSLSFITRRLIGIVTAASLAPSRQTFPSWTRPCWKRECLFRFVWSYGRLSCEIYLKSKIQYR